MTEARQLAIGISATHVGSASSGSIGGGGGSPGPLPDYATTVLAESGLVAYWRLGDSPGPVFVDSVNTLNLTAQGLYSASVGDLILTGGDGAVGLDGANSVDFLGDLNDPLLDIQTGLTIEVWFTYQVGPAVIAWYISSAGTEGAGYMMAVSAAGNFRFYTGFAGANFTLLNDGYLETSFSLTPGVIYHAVCTYSNPGNRVMVLNDVVAGTSVTTQPLDYSIHGGQLRNFQIGQASVNFSNFGILDGVVDEVAVYNQILPDVQRSLHYQIGTN